MNLPRIQPPLITAICMPQHHSVGGEKSLSVEKCGSCSASFNAEFQYVVFAFSLPVRKMEAVCSALQHCGGMAFLLRRCSKRTPQEML